jgi:hypothetical protein
MNIQPEIVSGKRFFEPAEQVKRSEKQPGTPRDAMTTDGGVEANEDFDARILECGFLHGGTPRRKPPDGDPRTVDVGVPFYKLDNGADVATPLRHIEIPARPLTLTMAFLSLSD